MGLLIISSMMVLGGMYLIFAFVWWILQIIANWNIFTKAGEAGWKSLIPIYGDYVSYKNCLADILFLAEFYPWNITFLCIKCQS